MGRLSGQMAMFCEQCGIHRDKLGDEASAPIRACPSCDRAICPHCWNLVANACLRCVPFDLPTATRWASVAALTSAPSRADIEVAAATTKPASAQKSAQKPPAKPPAKPKRPGRGKRAAAAVAGAASAPSWPGDHD
jgi:hypothetical protein